MTCIWRKLSIFSLKSFLSHYHLTTSPLSSSSPHLTLLWLPSIITIIMVISFNVVTLHCTAYSFKISMNVTMEAIRVMWMQTVKTRMALTTASVRKDTLGMDNRAKVYRNRFSDSAGIVSYGLCTWIPTSLIQSWIVWQLSSGMIVMKNTYNSYLFSLILIIVPVRKDKRETDNHVKVQKMSLSNS